MTRTHEFNLTGAARKPLIEAIEDFTKVKGVYQGAPKFGYAFYGIGVLDKAGALQLDCDLQVIMDLVTWLEDCGFNCTAEAEATEDDYNPENHDLCDREQPHEDWENCAEGFREIDDLPPMTEREEFGLGQERRDPIGEDGMQASDVPEWLTYKAELSDPDYPDRMEIFSADNDVDAYKEAKELCTGEIVLLELHQLDEDYNIVRGIDIQKLVEENNLYDSFSVEIPKNGSLSDEKMQNLLKLAESKQTLLTKAIGAPLKIEDGGKNVKLIFPYSEEIGIGEIYSQLAAAMVSYVKRHQRVTGTDKEVENEKFSLRTFMVKIGMKGAEYGAARKWYCRNLAGDAAFATPESKAKWQAKHMKTAEVQGDE